MCVRLLRFEDLQAMGIGYSNCWLRQLEKQNLFPKRRKIGPRRVAWRSDEVEAHIEAVAA